MSIKRGEFQETKQSKLRRLFETVRHILNCRIECFESRFPKSKSHESNWIFIETVDVHMFHDVSSFKHFSCTVLLICTTAGGNAVKNGKWTPYSKWDSAQNYFKLEKFSNWIVWNCKFVEHNCGSMFSALGKNVSWETQRDRKKQQKTLMNKYWSFI